MIVEYLDVEEEESLMIAMEKSDLIILNDHFFTYLHCEMHSPMILGVSASIISFLGSSSIYDKCISKFYV